MASPSFPDAHESVRDEGDTTKKTMALSPMDNNPISDEGLNDAAIVKTAPTLIPSVSVLTRRRNTSLPHTASRLWALQINRLRTPPTDERP
jgi:hypothetical protein